MDCMVSPTSSCNSRSLFSRTIILLYFWNIFQTQKPKSIFQKFSFQNNHSISFLLHNILWFSNCTFSIRKCHNKRIWVDMYFRCFQNWELYWPHYNQQTSLVSNISYCNPTTILLYWQIAQTDYHYSMHNYYLFERTNMCNSKPFYD